MACFPYFPVDTLREGGASIILNHLMDEINKDDLIHAGSKNTKLKIKNDAIESINSSYPELQNLGKQEWIDIVCAPENSKITIEAMDSIYNGFYNPLKKTTDNIGLFNKNKSKVLVIYARNPDYFKLELDPMYKKKGIHGGHMTGSTMYIFRDKENNLVLHEGIFFPKDEFKSKHLTDLLFFKQINTAKRLNFLYITGFFCGGSRSHFKDASGYYYFPTRFGFDAPLNDENFISRHKTVQEYIKNEGDQAWKKNGIDMKMALML